MRFLSFSPGATTSSPDAKKGSMLQDDEQELDLDDADAFAGAHADYVPIAGAAKASAAGPRASFPAATKFAPPTSGSRQQLLLDESVLCAVPDSSDFYDQKLLQVPSIVPAGTAAKYSVPAEANRVNFAIFEGPSAKDVFRGKLDPFQWYAHREQTLRELRFELRWEQDVKKNWRDFALPEDEENLEQLFIEDSFGVRYADKGKAKVIEDLRRKYEEECEEYVGAGTGWLIRIGPVSDRFQTSAMSDAQSMSQCHFGCTVHVIVSCPMHSHVGCTVSCRKFMKAV